MTAGSLTDFVDPYLDVSWGELGARVEPAAGRATVTLGYPSAGLAEGLAAQLSERLEPGVAVDLKFEVPPGGRAGKTVPGVQHVIAVASGKGGVGKSTTAVNMALALSAEGAKVGLLDADIYGPSLGMMLGVPSDRRPEVRDGNRFVPIKALGLKAMSMSFLVTDKTPMVWRGPMASGALQQLINQTEWSDLDYLIVDMPPGTGDIQLTLSQSVPVSGAVIVTTPQDIALLDAKKAIEMFAKVDIPVLGVLENMSVHLCPSCGHQSHIFGEGGAARIAAEYDQVLLGALPLDISIRELADSGTPSVAADPDSAVSALYRDAARHLAARLWQQADKSAAPTIRFADD
ncbi:MAG: iron-sulfur cluster carrier protein ApbC [Pseudomonadota bacterium]